MLRTAVHRGHPLYLGVVAAALAAGLIVGCKDHTSPARDEPGDGPPRVVTLTPSSTEAVAAVAGVEAIVGVDEYSSHPPEVSALPKVGSYLSPNLEAILRLEPDLVVLDRVQTKVIAGLEAAGVKALPLRMERVDDVAAGMTRIGEALGMQAEAAEAVAALEGELERVRHKVRRSLAGKQRPRVLFIVDRELGGLSNMTAAGPGTFLADLVEMAGADSALDHSPVSFPRISVEEVLTLAPEVIVDGVHTPALERAAADWEVLSTVPAVKDGRVYVLGDPGYMNPNPRMARTVETLAELIHGEP